MVEAATDPGNWILYTIVGPLVVAIVLGGVAAMIKLFRLVGAMHNVMVTRKPTELEPNPPKGLIDETRENTEAVYNMSLRINQSNGTQKDIQRVQGDIQTAQVEILHRLETIAGTPPATLPQVEEAIGEHDAANQAGQQAIIEAIHDK